MEKARIYLNELLNDRDVVVIGLSGGPDSMCLLSLLLKCNVKIIAAHVHHNIRHESDQELLYCKEICQNNNVVFESMKIEKYANDNFHNEARNIRYEFFDKIVAKYKANYLMTAHHGDDLMETILMRLVRGSSLKGYAGFAKEIDCKKYKLIRPLIEYPKETIIKYLEENNIKYVTDQSNFKDCYTRNRYRNHVLPFLKKEDSNVHSKFYKFSKVLFEYNNYVDALISKNLKKVYNNKELNVLEYLKLDDFVKTKIIEQILNDIYFDDLFLVNDHHINLIKELINNKKSNILLNLPKKIVVKKDYNKVLFDVKQSPETDYVYVFDNYIDLDFGIIKQINNSNDNSNYTIYLSSSEIKMPLIVRNRKYGDKIAIKNLSGTKKIKDVFIDEKISVFKRNKIPVVTDSENKILWLPGIKKSKYDKEKNEKYDIILNYEEENYE